MESLLKSIQGIKNRRVFFGILIPIILNSCTLNVSMANTEGKADDVIDDTQSNSPTVSPNVNVPLSASPYDLDEINFGCKG